MSLSIMNKLFWNNEMLLHVIMQLFRERSEKNRKNARNISKGIVSSFQVLRFQGKPEKKPVRTRHCGLINLFTYLFV